MTPNPKVKSAARQQELRYEVIAGATFPDVTDAFTGKRPEVAVDKITGSISISSELPNYEDLIVPDDEISCDLGPPVLVGGLNSAGADDDNEYDWVGRFPNGVGGICRMSDMDTREDTGKKDSLTYLDAAALCAKGGGRLPLYAELVAAAEIASAPTAEGSTDTPARKDNERGWSEGTGQYPLRAMNIMDTWFWPDGEQEKSKLPRLSMDAKTRHVQIQLFWTKLTSLLRSGLTTEIRLKLEVKERRQLQQRQTYTRIRWGRRVLIE